ncbi:MAG TPA: TIGR00730 family Rossman fold protein [Polyangiaceae bacterium]|nr:TIGR00730 family Rossman fold protein [Polyangiaceae bacterium]
MRLCVFCGSSFGSRDAYRAGAEAFGGLLARRQIELVYGGARVGLMGALADAVLAGGGRVIGVIPEALMEREIAHAGLTDLRVVGSMHERKALMASLADGFVALPGGIGTLEELFEVWTWSQLGLHAKPCALLDVDGFYAGLASFMDHVVAEGFLKPAQRQALIVDANAEALLERMACYRPEAATKWIDGSQS